jgi:hypothetical protein
MKTAVFLLLSLVAGFAARATECVDKQFIHPHIDFTLCQNYSNYNEIRTMHYQLRAELLEKWWMQDVPAAKRGKVKFSILILDYLLTYNHVKIERFGDSCAISVSGFVTLGELASYMNYCVSAGFKPMPFNWYRPPSNMDSLRSVRDKLLRNHFPATINKYINEKNRLWIGGPYALVCGGDSLWYACNNEVMRVKPLSTLPFQVKDRWLFFQPDQFFVMEGCKVLLEEKVSENFIRYDDYRIEEWNGDIRIGYGNDLYYYLYNYAENTFTEVRKNPEQR